LERERSVSYIKHKTDLSVKLLDSGAVGEIAEQPRTSSPARERILESAYDLFSQRGIRGVGIDEVIERAAVAKATLYRHFPSKDDLVLAFLARREE
jgi:AcrR family transcriptional regulator